MKPQPKTVRAWAFAWRSVDRWRIVNAPTRDTARDVRRNYGASVQVGPIERISVSAPKERKR